MHKTTIRMIVIVVLLICAFAGPLPTWAYSGLQKTTVAYRMVDGHKILADVYRPEGKDVRPVIVYIHGGALIMGSRQLNAAYPLQGQLLSLAEERGYALVSIDYRLAPETKLPDIISDIEAAFSWLSSEGAKRFHLDTTRMVVVGGSAGGYLTLVTGYRVTPAPTALVALYGYGELNADWYAKPNPYPNYNRQKVAQEEAIQQINKSIVSDGSLRTGDGGKIYMYYRQNGLWPQEVSGFSPESLPSEIAAYEPVKHVTRQYPPTLLIHGTQDTDVPFDESVKMSQQFQKHGVPHILVPIEKGEHGFAGGSPAKIEEAFATMKDFMLRYLEPNTER